jgi:hypothetical protein
MILRDRIARITKLRREVCEQLIIQGKLPLQGAIGHPSSAAKQVNHLIEYRIEIHHRPSTCASAASAWGSQKVMSMARYRSMAADSSARAGSR